MTEDKRILKHFMIDILNLMNGIEDNLLLIQKVHHIVKHNKSVSTDLLNAITGIQHYIDAINTVCTLGVSWPKDDIDFVLKALDGKFFLLKINL